MPAHRDAEVIAVHPRNAAHGKRRVVLRVAPIEQLIVQHERLAHAAVQPNAEVARARACASGRAPRMREMIAEPPLDFAVRTRARITKLPAPRGDEVEEIAAAPCGEGEAQMIRVRHAHGRGEAKLVAPTGRIDLADQMMKALLQRLGAGLAARDARDDAERCESLLGNDVRGDVRVEPSGEGSVAGNGRGDDAVLRRCGAEEHGRRGATTGQLRRPMAQRLRRVHLLRDGELGGKASGPARLVANARRRRANEASPERRGRARQGDAKPVGVLAVGTLFCRKPHVERIVLALHERSRHGLRMQRGRETCHPCRHGRRSHGPHCATRTMRRQFVRAISDG